MNNNRPVNLDLGSLKYPPMAIASILHRISGIILFLLFPVMLCFLDDSLHSEGTYEHLRTLLSGPQYKLLLWVFGSAWIFHVLAGIRHMLMDMGLGEQLDSGRRSAVLVITLAIILAVILGVWIW